MRRPRADALLAVTAEVAQMLMGESDVEAAAARALALVAETSGVDRIYVFENHTDPATGALLASQRYEWAGPGVEPQIDNPDLQDQSYALFPDAWTDDLRQGRPVAAHVRTLPGEGGRDLLAAQGIRSLLLLPMVADGTWYGFVGFDHCRHEHTWTAEEQAVLKVTASLFAGLSERRRRSEELDRFFAIAPDLLVIVRSDGTLVRISSASEAILGYASAEMLGRPVFDFIHPDDVEHTRAEIRRLQAGRGQGTFENRYRHRDGSYRWLQWATIAAPARGVRYAIARDVTQQRARDAAMRERERALRESEQRFRSLVQATTGVIWQADEAGRVTELSSAWRVFTGQRAEATTGWGWVEAVHPDDRSRIVADWQAHLADRTPYECEYRVRRHDGVYHWFAIRAVPVYTDDGTFVEWFGTCTDIHERVTALQQLRLLETAVSEATESIVITTVVPGRYPRILFVNPAFERMTGYAADEAAGQSPRFLAGPETDVRRMRQMLSALRHGEHVVGETVLYRKDGSPFQMEWSVSPVHDDDGRVTHVLAVLRDVTERLRAAEELRQAKEEAEEMARLKSSLLANMSHEIRTPLTAIIGFSELLATEFEGEGRTFVEVINRGGKRLLETLNSVLDLARLESRSFRLRPEPVDVSESVAGTAELMRNQVEAGGLDLVVDLPPEPLLALVDRGALERVLANLLSNALKFTEQGRVTLRAGADGDAVWVEVEDTGVGISSSFLAHVFDEFKQESAGDGRTHEGSGLGLTITRRLVNHMGGTIAVESEKGRGSRFTLRFPRGADAAAA